MQPILPLNGPIMEDGSPISVIRRYWRTAPQLWNYNVPPHEMNFSSLEFAEELFQFCQI